LLQAYVDEELLELPAGQEDFRAESDPTTARLGWIRAHDGEFG